MGHRSPHGVRVVGIAPEAVPVPSHYKSSPIIDVEQAIRDCGKGIPCGFAGTSQDISNLALFLASEAARYIVGQTLLVDGAPPRACRSAKNSGSR